MASSRLVSTAVLLITLSWTSVPELLAQDGGGGDPVSGSQCFGDRLFPTFNGPANSPNAEYLANGEPFDAICLPEAWAFMKDKWQAASLGIPNWPFAVVIDDGFFEFEDSGLRPWNYPGYPDGSLSFPYGTALGGASVAGKAYGHHGTAVFSLLASRGNNGKYLVGAAAPWDQIPDGRFFGPTYIPVRIGFAGPFGDDIPELIRAFEEVVFAYHEVRLVNLSQDLVAIPAQDAMEFEPRLQQANSNQVAVVVAAGNDQRTVASGHWLRQHQNVILVGALNHRGDDLWIHGPHGTATGDAVDLYAPGENIEAFEGPSSIRLLTGTSFAAPMVSGVVAMMQNLEPTLYPAAVRAILVATADPIQTSTGQVVPRLNARRALECTSTLHTSLYAPGAYTFVCDSGPQGPVSGTYKIR
ncbi:MAG: S8/S53 family peptidase [Acidobacteriota bacterium]